MLKVLKKYPVFSKSPGGLERLGAFPVSQHLGGRADPVLAPPPLTAKLSAVSLSLCLFNII